MIQISVTVDVSKFVAWAEEAETRLANMGPFMQAMEQPVADHLRQHMADQAGPNGPFAALTPKYARWKNKFFGGQPILQLRGPMLESITPGSDEANTWAEFTVPYATFHQTGTYKMVARPPAWISPQAADAFTQRVADWAITGELGGVLL